ncbi:MAG: hypothetical protein IJY65_04220 [Clostridia bacterium]|nr:hypothetical protein [Clostridia bacterium]
MENNDKIKDILDKIKKESENKEAAIKQGGIEFEFSDVPDESGLVFEDFGRSTPTEEPVEEVQKEEPSPAPEEPSSEEFSIPESYGEATAEDEEVPDLKEEEPVRIWTTYIPRFTEASENYRMATSPKSPSSAPKVEKEETPAEPPIDPFEEIGEDKTDNSAVSVKVNTVTDLPGESMSVYKFANDDAGKKSAPEVSEEEKILSSVSEFLSQNDEDEAEHPEPEAEATVESPVTEETAIAEYTPPAYPEAVAVVDEPAELDNYDGRLKSGEYTNFSQRDSFKDRFLDTIMSVKVRFFAALFILLFMTVYENLGAFGVDLVILLGFSSIRWAVPLIDMQFVLCLLALAIPELIGAFRMLVKGRLSANLTLVVSALGYCGYIAALMVINPESYVMFGSVFGISALISIVATYLSDTADFTAFKTVSVNGEKRALDCKSTRTLERENLALDGAVSEYKSKTARLYRTVFISDFFARARKTSYSNFNTALTLIVSFGTALVSGAICFFVYEGLISALSTFSLVLSLACPAVSLILYKLPYYHAERECEREKSALVGECAVDEYSDVDVVTFHDTEIFGTEDVNLKHVMVFGNAGDISTPLRHMSALFQTVGGPLDYMFSSTFERKCAPATGTVIEEDGISGMADGYHVAAGTRDYMLRHGVDIPEEQAEQKAPFDSTRIMYASKNGKVYAKFSIRYSFSEQFTMLLPVLKKEGIVPLVYTRDPNLDKDLISTLTAGVDCIRLMKKTSPSSTDSDSELYRRASVGIVTQGDKTSAINALLLVKRYKKLLGGFSTLEISLASVNAALAAALALVNMTPLTPAVVFCGWQLLWCAILYILSRRSFSTKQKRKDQE